MYSSTNQSMNGDMNQFLLDLQYAMDGEYSAIQCYEKMAGQASNKKEMDQILEIRDDEFRHYEQFSQIYTSLTGQQYSPELNETCPENYRIALLKAFENEQKAVDFYLDMSERAPQGYIRRILRKVAAEEQNHAIWFLSYLTIR
ncbi:ferritin-like domain-containing protein [Evansella tamaricis]|uniref:Ferritin-like domain-containing protein n=1 Tax=Evansella tamaricis TaxID=2069301 RepID=A0ABS6JJR5_9BACI|nr:ferritin-like domain-containing protein [Evansella tamaricis]MBU9713439.1 ferritin-like domain-containing protein [Evansella tamaricis]